MPHPAERPETGIEPEEVRAESCAEAHLRGNRHKVSRRVRRAEIPASPPYVGAKRGRADQVDLVVDASVPIQITDCHGRQLDPGRVLLRRPELVVAGPGRDVQLAQAQTAGQRSVGRRPVRRELLARALATEVARAAQGQIVENSLLGARSGEQRHRGEAQAEPGQREFRLLARQELSSSRRDSNIGEREPVIQAGVGIDRLSLKARIERLILESACVLDVACRHPQRRRESEILVVIESQGQVAARLAERLPVRDAPPDELLQNPVPKGTVQPRVVTAEPVDRRLEIRVVVDRPIVPEIRDVPAHAT